MKEEKMSLEETSIKNLTKAIVDSIFSVHVSEPEPPVCYKITKTEYRLVEVTVNRINSEVIKNIARLDPGIYVEMFPTFPQEQRGIKVWLRW